jgi:hypothetical protein
MSKENPFYAWDLDRAHDKSLIDSHGCRGAKRNACTQNGGDVAPEVPPSLDAVTTADVRDGHVSLRVLLGARLFGASLDNRLAQGQSPASSRYLALRAQLIALPAWRRELAENWLSLIEVAREQGSRSFSAQVPLMRTRIIDTEARIRELVCALVSPMPTARGVAMASSLLSDGSGPLYYRDSTVNLDSKLYEVLARLDATAE